MIEKSERRLGLIEKIKRSTQTREQQKVTTCHTKKVTEDIESFSFNTAI